VSPAASAFGIWKTKGAKKQYFSKLLPRRELITKAWVGMASVLLTSFSGFLRTVL